MTSFQDYREAIHWKVYYVPKICDILNTALHRNQVWQIRNILEKNSKENEPPLHTAARCGYSSVMKALIDDGGDLNQSYQKSRFTVLHTAAHYGCSEAVEKLFESRADIYAKDGNGMCPLHWAAYMGHVKATDVLISAGTRTNVLDSSGSTPLIMAARAGDRASGCSTASVVRKLLSARADVNATDGRGSTPLHWAAGKGLFEKAQALITARADVNARDNSGKTVLNWAKKSARWNPATLRLITAAIDAKAVSNAAIDANAVANAVTQPFRSSHFLLGRCREGQAWNYPHSKEGPYPGPLQRGQSAGNAAPVTQQEDAEVEAGISTHDDSVPFALHDYSISHSPTNGGNISPQDSLPGPPAPSWHRLVSLQGVIFTDIVTFIGAYHGTVDVGGWKAEGDGDFDGFDGHAYSGKWSGGRPCGVGWWQYDFNRGSAVYAGGVEGFYPCGHGMLWSSDGRRCFEGEWGGYDGRGFFPQEGIMLVAAGEPEFELWRVRFDGRTLLGSETGWEEAERLELMGLLRAPKGLAEVAMRTDRGALPVWEAMLELPLIRGWRTVLMRGLTKVLPQRMNAPI